MAHSDLAEVILSHPDWQSLVYDQGRKTWLVYAASLPGVWSEVDEAVIAQRVDTAAKDNIPQGFNASTVRGTLQLLELRLGCAWSPSPADLLPLRNGTLHVPTLTLTGHDPASHFRWQLPYDYDPAATCEPIEKWLEDVTGHDDDTITLLRAYLRAVLFHRVDLERYLELIGPGGSGKGTFTRLAQALIGYDNSVVSNLKTLEGSRFETHAVVGKQLLVLTDEERYTGSVSVLKALTGEDTIRTERKYHDPIPAQNHCLVIVAANEPILSPDYTSGLARRRLSVRFDYRPTARRHLIGFDQAHQPTGEFAPHLPGLLNWVLALPDETMVAQLHQPTSVAYAHMKARTLIATNPLAAWAQECLIAADAKAYIGVARRLPQQDAFESEEKWLYASYRGWMLRAGFKDGVSLTRFSDLLEDLCRDQLGLDHVGKYRDVDGVHLTGLRLRTPQDGAIGWFIDTTIMAWLVVQQLMTP
jgi:putative DNA primase/helicase